MVWVILLRIQIQDIEGSYDALYELLLEENYDNFLDTQDLPNGTYIRLISREIDAGVEQNRILRLIRNRNLVCTHIAISVSQNFSNWQNPNT